MNSTIIKGFLAFSLLNSVVVCLPKIINVQTVNNENDTDPVCGIARVSRQGTPRIIGGMAALQGEWPWQVALIQIDPSTQTVSSQHCGGTLVSQKWIVTAAHCLVDPFLKFVLPPIYWRVSVDEIQPNKLNVEEYFRISRIVLHKEFNQKTWKNDMALIMIQNPEEKGKTLTPICLPAKSTYPTNKKCSVTGWGRTSVYGTYSSKLQTVEVPLINDKDCQKIYSKTNKLTQNMLCAGERFGGTGPCVGDSGGPIQCITSNGQWELLGVTSWGVGCAKISYPAVFMKINNYLDWIVDHVE